MIKRAHELEIGDVLAGQLRLSAIVEMWKTEPRWVDVRLEDGSIRGFGWFIAVDCVPDGALGSPSRIKNAEPTSASNNKNGGRFARRWVPSFWMNETDGPLEFSP